MRCIVYAHIQQMRCALTRCTFTCSDPLAGIIIYRFLHSIPCSRRKKKQQRSQEKQWRKTRSSQTKLGLVRMCEYGIDRNNTKCIKAQWQPTLSCSLKLLASYKLLSYFCQIQTHRDQTNTGKLGELEKKIQQLRKNSPLHKIDASFISYDAISSNRLMIAMMLIVIQVEYIVVIIYIAGCSVMHNDA